MSVFIQFSTSGSLIAKAVQFRTYSWASHVDVLTPENTLIGASWDSGVREIPNKPSDYRRIELYEVPDVDEQAIIGLMRQQLGKKYDFGAIFGFLSRIDKFENQDKWFCSELIAWAFMRANMPLINPRADLHRISPAHLLLSPHLKFVEGAYVR